MDIDILINAAPYENRIALVENGDLLEFYLERPSEKGLVGNIYYGRVVRVLPGMQAAFVDIGLERTGFLYVDDIHASATGMERIVSGQEQICSRSNVMPREVCSGHKEPNGSTPCISKLLREGEEILVQISKEPIGTKGARLTCHITLPCRNLVFMPLTDHIGISRKIADEEVRSLLREKIEKLRPPRTGFIVRTVAENVSEGELEADMEFLLLLWDDIKSRCADARAPSLVYKDLDIVLRSVRDLFTDDVRELIIDSPEAHRRLLTFVRAFAPDLEQKISLHRGELPLFESRGIEVEINRALDKKVWLRSGGYIVIETTEALTVIDVNTGRYVGKNDLGETIFKTNMEAVKEIAYQLRLRNIGGIIIIDFIDMEDEDHKRQVLRALEQALSRDHAKTHISQVSPLGLVEMTRKRSRESLEHILCETCPTCAGRGSVKTPETVCYEIFREILREVRQFEVDRLLVLASQEVVDLILDEESAALAELEDFIGKPIQFQVESQYTQEQYDVVLV